MTAQEATFLRTEREVAANAVWALVASKVIPVTTPLAKLVSVTGISFTDLRLARERADRVPLARLKPGSAPTRTAPAPAPAVLPERVRHPEPAERPPLPAAAYERDPAPKRGDLRSVPTYTDAGRKRAAERVFAQWRVRGSLDCTKCGKPIHSGSDAVIETAHHADRCP